MDAQRRQNYKLQKQNYRTEKKRVAAELLSTLQDPTVVVMADWLKIRSSLRNWSRLFCVLKPGLLILYKSPKTQKHGYWVGTVLLSSCELIERPSKKDGFCFKLFHPLDQSIWAVRGPQGEAIPAVTMPLPSSYLICRASAEDAGRCWMDALELALRCSSLLVRTMNRELRGSSSGLANASDSMTDSPSVLPSPSAGDENKQIKSAQNAENHHQNVSFMSSNGISASSVGGRSRFEHMDSVGSVSDNVLPTLDESEAERHFIEEGLDEENEDADSANGEDSLEAIVEETGYVMSPPEVFGASGDAEQVEEIADENKSLIWSLMKQVRPGMDLSKVVLPTFILEPRSFLEKLADFYYHADILKEAVEEDDPFLRMKTVVRFYLSGFYKKPKGLKKPYNPNLGEMFRCYWQNPDGSRTFYIAEQVSHHPPVSALFVSNRKAGFNISATILAKSKFYGNSLSALMLGSAKLALLSRGEIYTVTLPYAHCKGLIIGTLTMEMGGTVKITSDRTSYSTELEFKLKPFLSSSESLNVVSGKIKLGSQTMATIEGHWDANVYLTNKITQETEVLWQASHETREKRLKRFIVPVEQQEPFESERLWTKVSEAIHAGDQQNATAEKTVLEEAQRKRAREIKETSSTHEPKLFQYDPTSDQWHYKHADYRPWDPQNDVSTYENNFIIRTRTRHLTPLIKPVVYGNTAPQDQIRKRSNLLLNTAEPNGEESDEGSGGSRESMMSPIHGGKARNSKRDTKESLENDMNEIRKSLASLSRDVAVLQFKIDHLFLERNGQLGLPTYLLILAAFVMLQAVLIYFYKGGFGL